MHPLSRAQVRNIDQRAINDFGLPGIVLMENAGRNAAAIIQSLLATLPPAGPTPIPILCGPGNNGGDGFVIARHLTNAGHRVICGLAADASRLHGDALTNYHVAAAMAIPIHSLLAGPDLDRLPQILAAAPLIIDALLGTGATGQPRPPCDQIIRAVNTARANSNTPATALVVAIDLPSGLDCDTGQPADPTIRADHTITFVAPKLGFEAPAAREYVGHVHVADIGAPAMLFSQQPPAP